MAEPRTGRQTPTESHILPYQNTKGPDAVREYEKTGREAQDWQKLLLYDLLATNDDGLWTHTRFGYSVPRRNGKNEVIAMRELYGLLNGEHILHTAHRTTTTHSAWERLLDLLEMAEIKPKSTYRAFGKEHIFLDKGKIEFRTRTSKGGLGEGFDLLVIDEAQEYQDDQESALKYTVSDSQNPQTIFTGTPPTPLSSGTVFTKFRKAVLAGETENSAWAEWSVDKMTDMHDKDAWYETNPSLGAILSERSVTDEIGGDPTDFNIQRLGLWLKYNQKSAISEVEWNDLLVKKAPKLGGKLYIGIKYGHDGMNVSLSIASKIPNGKIYVETYDCCPIREGDEWIIDLLERLKGATRKVVVDGANRQSVLAAEMKKAGLKSPCQPTVKQIINANAVFEKAIYDQTLCHTDQPSLRQSVSNCEKRTIGTAGGFGYKSIREDIDVCLLDSVILAHWAAADDKSPGRPVKQVRY